MKFGIFCCGYNCKAYATRAMASVKAQTMKEFSAVFVDDCSTDCTSYLLNAGKDCRCTVLRNEKRLGGTLTRLRACEELDRQGVDVMVMLDMDDELLPNALERIAVEYDAGAWMTYGNWIDEKQCIHEHVPMSDAAYAMIWGSASNWFLTHAMTFRADLWRQIPNSNWYHHDGTPFGSGQSDALLMIALAGMAGPKRIHGISDVIYRYTRFGSESCIRVLPKSERDGDWAEVAQKPRLPMLEEL